VKKTILIILVLSTTFGLGFAFSNLIKKKSDENAPLKRVTGIGGIFFKCNDPGKMKEWYKTHLGLNVNKYGTVFEWRQAADSTKKGFTQWSPFNVSTSYFKPSTKDFMINYRVADLTALVDVLKKEGVIIVDTLESTEYGKFIHILDIEGNKVELWEPIDVVYEQLGVKMGIKTTK
jgi:predicted enzyme related to lactoylglutathione lyase